MIGKIVLSVIVAIVTALVVILLGTILLTVGNDPTTLLPTVGKYLKDYGVLIGVLAGLWHYFAGSKVA